MRAIVLPAAWIIPLNTEPYAIRPSHIADVLHRAYVPVDGHALPDRCHRDEWQIVSICRMIRRFLASCAQPAAAAATRGLPRKWPIPGVENVVLVSSAKGGVGKSTTAGLSNCIYRWQWNNNHACSESRAWNGRRKACMHSIDMVRAC